ncbi:MAG TPA: ShlB/FhaC/HecB family hemolysin secretion/activation protein [Rhodoferax sp.]|nr:ShlB/FhaC/HecB family hemolysin secretion/activation protein [Rhodoferax sp.]
MMSLACEKSLFAGAVLCLSLLATLVQAADPAHLPATSTTRPPDYLKPDAGAFQLPTLDNQLTIPTLTGSTERVRVGRVDFEGNTVLATPVLQAIAAPYVGRVVTVAELEALRRALTLAYVERGYVNSGVLLPRQIVDGVLVFSVVEGHLSAIRLHGMQRLDQRYLTQRLAPDKDVPLNIEVLRERFQLLLADPLISRLNARISPGVAPGEAMLDIDVTRARSYQFSAFANNYRPASIGSESVGVTAMVHNLTTRGDILEASVQSPPHFGQGTHSTLAWQMPLGFAGTRINIALERGSSSVVEEPTNVLDIRSTLDSTDVGLSRVVFESLRQKLALGLNRVSRKNRTWLLGEPFSFTPGDPTGSTQETLWRFWQDYSVRSETQVLALRSTLTYGKNSLQDTAGLPESEVLARQFHLWLGQAQFGRQVMDNGAQLVLRATLQHTRDRLLALDGLAIGGVNTVRGYRENQLVRDKGAFVNFEFEYPLLREAADGLSLTLIPFYDYGRAQNVGEAAVTLSSWGLGSRLQWQRFNLDLVLAKRLSHPDSVSGNGSTLQDHGVHLQLAYRF